MTWKVLARHKWVQHCSITESINTETGDRRFTATILGWRNWRIFQGDLNSIPGNGAREVRNKVEEILDRIIQGDESVFTENVTLTPPERSC